MNATRPSSHPLHRFTAAMAIALALACMAPHASAQAAPTTPAAKSFSLGAFTVSVLRDNASVFPNDGAIFGLDAGPKAVAKVLRQAGAPTDEIRLDVDALLIRMPGHLVLVDTGYGAAGHGVMRESLALVGVSPADITDVLITHAHPDHVGGLIDAQGRSVFPKATIRMSAAEWKFMATEASAHQEIPTIRAQVKTFQPGAAVLPGITSIALSGHTPGQVGYQIVSQGHRLVDIGDVAHSTIISLAKPQWTLAWDSNKDQAVKTRQRELQRLATTHELMFAPHFPFPGVGRIQAVGDGFRFQPEIPADK